MLLKVAFIFLAVLIATNAEEEDIWKRSLQPGAPNINNNKKEPWQLDPHVGRDDNGNTNAGATIQHHGDKHDFEAGWSKVVRGPNKAKPSWHVGGTYRWRRSLQPGAPNINNNNNNKQPWQLDPHVGRDDNGNTNAGATIQHHGDNHDFEAGWSKVVRGPNKAKPSWHVGGTYRWRRSLQPGAPNINNNNNNKQPWQLDPHVGRDDNGNTNAGATIQHHGVNHDFEAGWSKVVRGPNKAKPSWHVGGTYRWRRSLQPGAPNINNNNNNKQPWQLDPHVGRDDNGNTNAGATIQHHGDNHDFEAGWSKVVRGPNKAKPSWHVGGTYRWRRSLQPGAPNINNNNNNKQPWQLDPHVGRDDNGNTNAGATIQHHGVNHDFEAGWSKVVRGPNKAKPSWHVGGTYRWRRSLQPGAPNINNNNNNKQPWQLDPHVGRDDNGNTNAGATIQHHGVNHDFEAGWSKVVRGPNKAKPSWHVGGTYRWRRSLQPGAPNINNNNNNKQPWQLDPHVGRDDNGNTNAGATIQHHGDNHDFEAGWSKVVRGPNKAKPSWHVGGTYRWRRSLQPGAPNINNNNNNKQPWQLDPHVGRDDNGNTNAGATIQHHGDNHDFEAGWSKVVRGPNKAKPSWHVGGTYRWRRSLQPGAPNINNNNNNKQPWQLDPHVGRDDNGNTNAGATIQHHGVNHDFEAGWSKVVRGPNKAKPSWHVGGTYRWRRSLQPGAPNINNNNNNKQPWQLDPHVGRDDNGNTNAGATIQHHGDNHDFEAGWSKVVRGPNKAKPSWHVGGTYRWRRSLQPGAPNINNNNNNKQPWQLDPHVGRDDNGNTNAGANIQHHGGNHDFEAGWSKVVRGPNKAKPTWHVGGTYRWRRSPYPDVSSVILNEDSDV